MALSITKEGTFDVVYSIPLVSGNDSKWEDNTWLVDHLRHLADKIEEEQVNVYSMGVEMDAQYKSPRLVLKGWKKKEWEIITPPDFSAERLENYGRVIEELSKVEDINKFTGHDRLCEEFKVTRQELNWFIHQSKFGKLFIQGIMAVALTANKEK